MKLLIRPIKIVLTLFAVFCIFTIQYIRAEEQTPTGGVTVWPTLHVLSLKRGEKREIKTFIKNLNEGKISVVTEFKNLKYGSKNTDQHSIDENISYPATWLKSVTDSSFTLEKNETKEVISEIEIPVEAEIRGYYPLILFRFAPEEPTQKVLATSGQIASIVYLSIGDIKGIEAQRVVSINRFFSDRRFSFHPEVKLTTEIQNNGNVHFRPRGYIEIFDPTGRRKSDTPKLNETLQYLLPRQTLMEEFFWKDKPSSRFFPPIGNYKMVLHLTTVEDRSINIDKTIYFFVLPLQYPLSVAFILCTIALLTYTGIIVSRKLKIKVKMSRRRLR